MIIIYLALLMCRLCMNIRGKSLPLWDKPASDPFAPLGQTLGHLNVTFTSRILELLKVKENNLFLVDVQGRIETLRPPVFIPIASSPITVGISRSAFKSVATGCHWKNPLSTLWGDSVLPFSITPLFYLSPSALTR